jgi:hypothetical protein
MHVSLAAGQPLWTDEPKAWSTLGAAVFSIAAFLVACRLLRIEMRRADQAAEDLHHEQERRPAGS